MLIGVDFDNTIVCYDNVFYGVAVEKGLIPPSVEPTKEGVKDYLRTIDREPVWTELQGYVYGPMIRDAEPFKGVKNFFMRCKEESVRALIISHKTRKPFAGPEYDLHKYALRWIESKFFNETGLRREDVFLETTKEEKRDRIVKEGCTHFIDDLPEFFSESNLPGSVSKILFNPRRRLYTIDDVVSLSSWEEITKFIFGER